MYHTQLFTTVLRHSELVITVLHHNALFRTILNYTWCSVLGLNGVTPPYCCRLVCIREVGDPGRVRCQVIDLWGGGCWVWVVNHLLDCRSIMNCWPLFFTKLNRSPLFWNKLKFSLPFWTAWNCSELFFITVNCSALLCTLMNCSPLICTVLHHTKFSTTLLHQSKLFRTNDNFLNVSNSRNLLIDKNSTFNTLLNPVEVVWAPKPTYVIYNFGSISLGPSL